MEIDWYRYLINDQTVIVFIHKMTVMEEVRGERLEGGMRILGAPLFSDVLW